MTETPGAAAARGPIGETRSIGLSILWFILTIGIYGIYWVYKTHEEIKRYSGNGIGGVIGLVIYIVISPVTFFVIPSEVRYMYEDRRRRQEPGPRDLWALDPASAHRPDHLVRAGAGSAQPLLGIQRRSSALAASAQELGQPLGLVVELLASFAREPLERLELDSTAVELPDARRLAVDEEGLQRMRRLRVEDLRADAVPGGSASGARARAESRPTWAGTAAARAFRGREAEPAAGRGAPRPLRPESAGERMLSTAGASTRGGSPAQFAASFSDAGPNAPR